MPLDSLLARGVISADALAKVSQRSGPAPIEGATPGQLAQGLTQVMDAPGQRGWQPLIGPEMAPRGGARNYYNGASGDRVVAPRYSDNPVQNVQEHLRARGFEVPSDEGSGPGGTVNAYTGSSYVTGYKTDPATGLQQAANVRISDHSPGKNFQMGQDHWYDTTKPAAEAELQRYLDSTDAALASASQRRQEAGRLFDKIGYRATGNDRQQIIQEIDRALKEGRPTAKMRAVMDEP